MDTLTDRPAPTRRLWFRPVDPEDLEALRVIYQDERAMVFYQGVFSDEEIMQWIRRQQKRQQQDGHALWGLVEKKSGKLIGMCGLTWQPWKDQFLLEVGYQLAPAVWHRGYASEAARACRDYARDVLKADRLHAIIADGNTASEHVARACGMEAVDHDLRHYRGVDIPHTLWQLQDL